MFSIEAAMKAGSTLGPRGSGSRSTAPRRSVCPFEGACSRRGRQHSCGYRLPDDPSHTINADSGHTVFAGLAGFTLGAIPQAFGN